MRVVAIALAVVLGMTVPGVFVGWQTQPAVVAAIALGPPSLSSFEWASQASFSDVALEVRMRVEEAAECVLEFAAAGRTTSGGPEYIKVVTDDDGRGWSTLVEDGMVQAHAEGALDTRSVVRDGERWAAASKHRRPDMVGNFTWFVAASALTPWVGHAWTGEDSLRFLFSCEKEFFLESILVAERAILLSERSLRSGQTLQVAPLGTLVRDESVRAVLDSDQARLMVGQRGNEGDLSVSTPRSSKEARLESTAAFLSYPDGPGEYSVGLDCFCQGGLWGVLADLRPAAHLDALHSTG